ncbi:MAG: glycosyltransferase family 39 protein [bacterium]
MARDERRTGWLLGGLAALLVARQLRWLLTGTINEDELENLQILWLFDHGRVFGRDYVTSHLPTFSLLLAPLYRWRGVSPALPGLVRVAIAPLMAWTLAEVALLGRRIAGHARGALVAVILLLASPTLAASLSEARPDSVALPLALLAFRLFASYVGSGRVGTLSLAGLAFGLSFLFNPKAVLLWLATAWAAERHHVRELALPGSARTRRIAAFAVLALAPLGLALAFLAARGIVGSADVEVFLTTGYRWLDATRLAAYKRHLATRIVALSPLPWLLGAWALVRSPWRRDAPWQALTLAALAHGAQIALSAVLVTQMLLIPAALFAAAAARALRERSAATQTVAMLVAVLMPACFAAEDRHGRAEQTARMAFVLAHVPEDRSVLDGRYGLEAFRPLIGRFQQFRPWIYRPGVFANEQAEVLSAIASQRVGAVIHHPLYELFDPELRALIERHYAPSARTDVWLPRPRPAAPSPTGS